MSAFLLSDKHLGTLADAVLNYDIGGYVARRDRQEARAEVANLLKAQNINSVNARYTEQTPPSVWDSSFLNSTMEITPLQLLKMIASYNYQSCESGDWKQTEAYNLMKELEHRVIFDLTADVDIEYWDVH